MGMLFSVVVVGILVVVVAAIGAGKNRYRLMTERGSEESQKCSLLPLCLSVPPSFRPSFSPSRLARDAFRSQGDGPRAKITILKNQLCHESFISKSC